jgi:hypothetical protein
MWNAAAVVTDTHPEAPRGATILGLHLLWEGKGRASTYALLKAMGHPVDAWQRETDPAKLPDITPAFFYKRPFVLDCAVNDKGYLEPNGFMPYYAANAKRGPAPANASAGGAKGKPAGANGAGAHAHAYTPAAHANPDAESSLPF